MPFLIDTPELFINGQKLSQGEWFSLGRFECEAEHFADEGEALKCLIHTHSETIARLAKFDVVFIYLSSFICGEQLKSVIQQLLDVLEKPNGLNVYVFPYGRSAFLMSLARYKEIGSNDSTVGFVGLYAESTSSLSDKAIKGKKAADPHCQNEELERFNASLISGGLKKCSTGIDVIDVQYDKELDTEHFDLKFLLASLRKKIQQPIDFLLLPLSPNDAETKWLESLPLLSPRIVRESQYLFTDVHSGYLGPINGIIDMLTLLNEQEKSATEQQKLALNLSYQTQGYAVGALLSLG